MRHPLITAAVVAIVAAAFLAGSARPAGHASPGRNGLIAFASERNNLGLGIFTMHTDGTGLERLTSTLPEAKEPAVSPDGRLVAFMRVAAGDRAELWLVKADGTGAHPLLTDLGTDALDGIGPAWSPDGRWIGFRSQPLDHTRIELVRPDGSGRHVLARGYGPVWSPDGKRIAFTRDAWKLAIWVVGADGRGAHQIHKNADSPAWSPDGRRIAFTKATCDTCTSHLFVMDADGRHVRQVTHSAKVSDYGPVWSTDGKLIKFNGDADFLSTIEVVRPDGSGRRLLYRYDGDIDVEKWLPGGHRVLARFGGHELGPALRRLFSGSDGSEVDRYPRWSPDGRRILFSGPRGSAVMDANGSNRRSLGDLGPPYAWSPDGRRIVGESSQADDVDVLDVASGRSHAILADEGMADSTPSSPAWSAKGPIAYLEDGVVSLYVFGRHPPTQSLGFDAAEGSLEWSPDGRLLAYAAEGGTWVYDTRTNRRRLLVKDAFDLVFSPDGRRIAYVRAVTKTNTEIFVARSDGSGEKKVTANPGADVDPHWQPVR